MQNEFDEIKKLSEIIKKEIQQEMNLTAAEEIDRYEQALRKLAAARRFMMSAEKNGSAINEENNAVVISESDVEKAAADVWRKLEPAILKIKNKYELQRQKLFRELAITTCSFLPGLQKVYANPEFNCMDLPQLIEISKFKPLNHDDLSSQCKEIFAEDIKKGIALLFWRKPSVKPQN